MVSFESFEAIQCLSLSHSVDHDSQPLQPMIENRINSDLLLSLVAIYCCLSIFGQVVHLEEADDQAKMMMQVYFRLKLSLHLIFSSSNLS